MTNEQIKKEIERITNDAVRTGQFQISYALSEALYDGGRLPNGYSWQDVYEKDGWVDENGEKREWKIVAAGVDDGRIYYCISRDEYWDTERALFEKHLKEYIG